jgi:plastocyanin
MRKLIGFKSRFLTGFAFFILILSISNSCTKSTDYMNGMGNNNGSGTGAKGGPGANMVWIQGMAYNPSTITVASGTTITWINKDVVAHTVTSNDGLFDSGSMSASDPYTAGGTFTYTFSTPGSYSYHCSFHLTMTAKVIVN